MTCINCGRPVELINTDPWGDEPIHLDGFFRCFPQVGGTYAELWFAPPAPGTVVPVDLDSDDEEEEWS